MIEKRILNRTSWLALVISLVVGSMLNTSCTIPRSAKEPPEMNTELDIAPETDTAFLDMVERDSVRYFSERIHPGSGLVTEAGHNTLIGSNGYGMMAYCIAVQRGWMSRAQATDRVLAMLKTFRYLADHFRGVFGWIMDAETAQLHSFRTSYDLVETSYVCAGALVCRQFFDGDNEKETLIRRLATEIFERVEFDYFMGGQGRENTLAWGYNADDEEFGGLRIMGYNECMITYIMALASPTHPTPPESWDGWASSYRWESVFGYEYFYCPSLFPYQYSLVWLDCRNMQDRYTREKGITYFENSRRAALSHKAYAEINPKGYPEYGPLWGLTDCACPEHASGFGEHGLGWDPRDVANDDGTIGVTAAGGCIAFTPDESIEFMRYVYERYGEQMYDQYGFRNGMNIGLQWFDSHHEPLNKGAMLCLIENHRTGLFWNLFMRDTDVQRGIARAGFSEITNARKTTD